MAGKGKIIEVTISQLDWYIINRVKQLRKEKGISQSELSVKMGFSEKLVGSIENPTLKARYNISHLNLLAKALDCSIHELLPSSPFENDIIQLRVKKNFIIGTDGKPTKRTDFEVTTVKR
jgi:transcriptional regulator with XRE-family HTH domain